MKTPKIDYTPSGKTWEEIKQLPIECKWAPVAIESEYALDKISMENAIMSMDNTLSGYRSGGNDSAFNERIWYWANIPKLNFRLIKNGKLYTSYSEEIQDEWQKYRDAFDEEVEKWSTEFHRSKIASCTDNNVFSVDLISSCYIRGPRAWFEPSTGDIGLLHNIGKWPESIASVADELELFTKENPELDIIVTFFDEVLENDICLIKPLATVRLFDGKITPITTRTWEQVQYLNKVNYFKGSKNYHCKLYYKLYRLKMNTWRTFGKIAQTIFKSDIVWNSYVDKHNYLITKHENEQYFTEEEMYTMILNWITWCREQDR